MLISKTPYIILVQNVVYNIKILTFPKMILFAYKYSVIYKKAGTTGSLLTVDLALRIHEYY
jgi:hypothetical protein